MTLVEDDRGFGCQVTYLGTVIHTYVPSLIPIFWDESKVYEAGFFMKNEGFGIMKSSVKVF